MKYRFLDEYANHKKRQAKLYSSKDEARIVAASIDKILFMAHRGQILLDEAMRLLSEI